MTLYISFSILLAPCLVQFCVLRSLTGGIFRPLAEAYIEIVRNIPNLLWIYVIFVVFRLKSVEAE